MKDLKTTSEKDILVLGAKGKTGRRVLQRLRDAGLPARGVSRSANPSFDWEDRTTWEPVLRNTHAVYITYQPDIAVPGAVERVNAFAELAVRSGVKKLVLLSGRGEAEAQRGEEAVMNAGAAWTIVRASWFCQNFSEGNFSDQVSSGYVALPAAEVGEPFIDADDIADVVVAALTDDRHNGKIYEVTGPRLLTFKEAVGAIADATGKPIQYEQVPMEAFVETLTGYGTPAEVVLLIGYLFGEVLDGRNESTADGVEQALGRKPTDFSEYVQKAIAGGAWGNA